ncbi:MAG TPA: hypothetical protein PKA58_23400 [Polyangium sp.]|nr:hypothetical protein [Polyangium sp.]
MFAMLAVVTHARTFLDTLRKLGALFGIENRNDDLEHFDETFGHRVLAFVLGQDCGGVELIGFERFERSIHTSFVFGELSGFVVGILLRLRRHRGFDGLLLIVAKVDPVEHEHHRTTMTRMMFTVVAALVVLLSMMFAHLLATFLHAFLDERHELRALSGCERRVQGFDRFHDGSTMLGFGFVQVPCLGLERGFIDLARANLVREGFVHRFHLVLLVRVQVVDSRIDRLALFGGKLEVFESCGKERVTAHAVHFVFRVCSGGGFRAGGDVVVSFDIRSRGGATTDGERGGEKNGREEFEAFGQHGRYLQCLA